MSADEAIGVVVQLWREGLNLRQIHKYLLNYHHTKLTEKQLLMIVKRYIDCQTENRTYKTKAHD